MVFAGVLGNVAYLGNPVNKWLIWATFKEVALLGNLSPSTVTNVTCARLVFPEQNRRKHWHLSHIVAN